MAADEKDRYIQSLIDKINMFELDKRATELAVEEFQTHFDSVSSTLDSLKKDMESLKAELLEERSHWYPSQLFFLCCEYHKQDSKS